MPNCLTCKHCQIFPRDLALLRMTDNNNLKIQYKCNIKSPKIRRLEAWKILKGGCYIYQPTEEKQ